jgi:uncharacterized membrane protein YraQ (UPF0718 family)
MINIQRFLPLIVVYVLLQTITGQGVTSWLTTFATFFCAILLEAMPFMLIGAVISGAIEVFVPRETLARWVPRNRFLAVLMFGLMGIAFPICECGIVPVIRRLLKKGVPLSCGITYLLAAPIVQPIVFGATLVAFMGSWRVALYRVIGGYAIAVIVGTLSIFYLDPQTKQHLMFNASESEDAQEECSCHDHDHEHAEDCGCDHTDSDCGCGEDSPAGPRAKAEFVLKHAAEDFLSTGSYLIFGAFIAAAMQTFVGQDVLAKIGHGPILAPLVMMALAFTLSLCSAADAFVATSFSQFTIASRMAFLVMGPMVDIKLLAMYNGFLSKKATAFIFGSASVLAFCYALLLRTMGV